jgi:hypothetical protein
MSEYELVPEPFSNNIWKEHGYKNRQEYLHCMADDYGVAYSTVKAIADVLGPMEDFDDLIAMLEDEHDVTLPQ